MFFFGGGFPKLGTSLFFLIQAFPSWEQLIFSRFKISQAGKCISFSNSYFPKLGKVSFYLFHVFPSWERISKPKGFIGRAHECPRSKRKNIHNSPLWLSPSPLKRENSKIKLLHIAFYAFQYSRK